MWTSRRPLTPINTKFINSALTIFNFEPSFKHWVKVFFSGRQTYLLLHGYLGENIKFEQGVPQGDVLSPYIFNICVEILLLKICYTKELEGVKYAKRESRAECFADDTTVFIKRTEKKLRALVKIITDFSKVACRLIWTK